VIAITSPTPSARAQQPARVQSAPCRVTPSPIGRQALSATSFVPSRCTSPPWQRKPPAAAFSSSPAWDKPSARASPRAAARLFASSLTAGSLAAEPMAENAGSMADPSRSKASLISRHDPARSK